MLYFRQKIKRLKKTYTLTTIADVAKEIVAQTKYKIILFEGEMGAGKTTLIKQLVTALGSTDAVQSPTYTIVNTYTTTKEPIYHFDLYRITDIEELYDIGFEDYLNSNHWVFIEWPEIAKPFLTEKVTQLQLKIIDFETRVIQWQNK